jgi:hypothetical protein
MKDDIQRKQILRRRRRKRMSCHTVCDSFACYGLRFGYFIRLIKILDAGSKNRGKGSKTSTKKHI